MITTCSHHKFDTTANNSHERKDADRCQIKESWQETNKATSDEIISENSSQILIKEFGRVNVVW